MTERGEFSSGAPERTDPQHPWSAPTPEVSAAARRWGLELLERTHSGYSQTWFVRRGQQHLVLKVGGSTSRALEATCLRGYARTESVDTPPVACRLVAQTEGALLVERILLGDDLRPVAAADDDLATTIAGAVYARMHVAVAGLSRPAEVPALAEIRWPFDKYWQREDSSAPTRARLPSDLVRRAADMLAELSTPTSDDLLLHGDAHHQNLLRDGIGGAADVWRVIDPRGWWGDPTFEAVPLMLDLHDSLRVQATPAGALRRAARRRSDILAEPTGFDPDRLLDWTFVGAVAAELRCLHDHGFVQGGPLHLAHALVDG
ncbi:MAG: streptomycin 6-kinase [Actinomycetota bacterium]|nr:streptomycin 6-kinase [Actinomycetota bacterium]